MTKSREQVVDITDILEKHDLSRLPQEVWGYNSVPFVWVTDYNTVGQEQGGYGYSFSNKEYVSYMTRRDPQGKLVEITGLRSVSVGMDNRRRTQVKLIFGSEKKIRFGVSEGLQHAMEPLEITQQHADHWVHSLFKVFFEYLDLNAGSRPQSNKGSASVESSD